MRILAIETSQRNAGFALFDSDRTEDPLARELTAPTQSSGAVSTVSDLLAEAGWAAGSLDVVAASLGPGSFTGLRVGLTIANTLGYATGAVPVGVPTFEIVASQVEEAEPERLLVVGDAQRGEAFVQNFAREGEGWTPRGEVAIRSVEQIADREQSPFLVAGPGLTRFADDFGNVAGCVVADRQHWQPRAETLARLAASSPNNSTRALLRPIYIRRSAAEEKAERASASAQPAK